MIDSPRYTSVLAKQMEQRGLSPKFMLLTHRDDIGDHIRLVTNSSHGNLHPTQCVWLTSWTVRFIQKRLFLIRFSAHLRVDLNSRWAERFKLKRIMHINQQQSSRGTGTEEVEMVLEGTGPWKLSSTKDLLFLPGHTDGAHRFSTEHFSARFSQRIFFLVYNASPCLPLPFLSSHALLVPTKSRRRRQRTEPRMQLFLPEGSRTVVQLLFIFTLVCGSLASI